MLTLWLTGTTLNVMSLMGVVMLTGIAVSNSILIVEFTREPSQQGMAIREAVAVGCRVRLRPVLMTSLATLIGLLPMALKLGEGSESYAPLPAPCLAGWPFPWRLLFFLFRRPTCWFMGRNNMHKALAAERRQIVATAEGRGGMVGAVGISRLS